MNKDQAEVLADTDKAFFTREIIYHYNCQCHKWFSIADDRSDSNPEVKTCPHCGKTLSFNELEVF